MTYILWHTTVGIVLIVYHAHIKPDERKFSETPAYWFFVFFLVWFWPFFLPMFLKTKP